jgi:hypothetical protein
MIEMMGKRRRKQLPDDHNEMLGGWKLKEEALHRTVWRTRFGRGYGSVARQITELIGYTQKQNNLLPH